MFRRKSPEQKMNDVDPQVQWMRNLGGRLEFTWDVAADYATNFPHLVDKVIKISNIWGPEITDARKMSGLERWPNIGQQPEGLEYIQKTSDFVRDLLESMEQAGADLDPEELEEHTLILAALDVMAGDTDLS